MCSLLLYRSVLKQIYPVCHSRGRKAMRYEYDSIVYGMIYQIFIKLVFGNRVKCARGFIKDGYGSVRVIYEYSRDRDLLALAS